MEKNHYTKRERNLLPILKFSSNGNLLIVTDSLSLLHHPMEKLIEKYDSIFISGIKI